jgi:hypothetical protein
MHWTKVQDKNDYLVMDFRSNQAKMSPLDAGIYTVNHIIKNYPPPYTLMLSGGIDSQSMLWAWHKSGHKFDTLSVRYNSNMNDHDLKTLEEFSSRHQIPITFKDFDLLEFLEKEHDSWANAYDCSSPQICTYMKIASMITSGTRIFSGNFITNKVFLNYAILGIERYARITNTPIIGFFFLETPELAYSFKDIFNQIKLKDPYLRRLECYLNAQYPVIAQEDKYTGFEEIKNYYDQHYSHLVTVKHKLEVSKNPSRRTFDLLLRHPYEKKFNDPIIKTLMN